MSLWGALYVGSSGLKTSQNALNTVAHNLANADTKGYTRQQILQFMKNVIYYRKISFNPVQHKVPMGQEMNFPIPERIQARIIAQLQASSYVGQRLFCCFKALDAAWLFCFSNNRYRINLSRSSSASVVITTL